MVRKIDTTLGKCIIDLRTRIVPGFKSGNWEELGLLAGATDIIDGHPRLLRSLDWGDDDYDGNVLTVLRNMVERNPSTMKVIEDYVDEHFPPDSKYVSAKPSVRRITFARHVFQVPELDLETDLVAVMMPFALEFAGVYDSIKRVSSMPGRSRQCLSVQKLQCRKVLTQPTIANAAIEKMPRPDPQMLVAQALRATTEELAVVPNRVQVMRPCALC